VQGESDTSLYKNRHTAADPDSHILLSQCREITGNRSSRSWFHEKFQSALCRKRRFTTLGGGGGDPPTPSPSFFRRGSPPHPYAGQAGGHPLPLQVPAGPCHHTAKKPPEPTLHAGGSRRNTGHCDAEKRSSRHLEGEGGDPPTPPPSFFPEGITPHPYAGQAGGAPPPRRSRPDSLVRSVAAMSTARAVGSRECHDLILHWPVGRYPDGLIPRFECSTKKRTLTTL
jgi:hypothetical protein